MKTKESFLQDLAAAAIKQASTHQCILKRQIAVQTIDQALEVLKFLDIPFTITPYKNTGDWGSDRVLANLQAGGINMNEWKTVTIVPTTNEQLAVVRAIQNALNKFITFDTGIEVTFGKGLVAIDWELDWSVKLV